jgi:hypothetical protein
MKKIMLLALAAVCAAVFALPATASALLPLHLNPTPGGAQTIDSNGKAILSTSGSGIKVECQGFSGSATFEAGGTTGTMQLTFGPNCTTSFGGTCTNEGLASSIKTTSLPFHLVTVGGKPGVLVTPGANEHFATFTCHNVLGLTIESVVKGNGVIGTITAPECGASSKEATIVFSGEKGVQNHKTVDGTTTEYSLTKGSETAAQSAHGTLTLSEISQLVCT